jgi:hypothetical protein
MDSYQDFRNSAYERALQESEERKRQEKVQAETLAQESEQKQTTKSTPQKDPKQFGLKDNIKEVGDAFVAGGINIYNSVASLPKLLDKRFYQPTDPSNPWKYDSPLLIKKKPITETKWGTFLEHAVEMVGGIAGTGKVMWGIKGLKGLATAAKATRAGRIGLSAVQGATYDVISNQSQESNLARVLVDTFPNKAGILEPLATKESMSPAMKSFYNIGEGLGIGAFLDVAFEGVGWGLRSHSLTAKKAAKKITGDKDELLKAINNSSDTDYALVEAKVLKGAKQLHEKAEYRKYVNKTTKANVEPLAKPAFLKRNKSWERLDPEIQMQKMNDFAEKNDIDWGDYRDLTQRSRRQGQANRDLEIEQLERDISQGKPRKNPAYYKGGDVTDNQALSTSGNPVESVRDMIEIRNNPNQKYGSPRGGMTEANIRRVEYRAPGMMLDEINAVSKKLKASPSYQRLSEKVTQKAIKEDMAKAYSDIIVFLNDSGHSRLIDVPEKELLDYLGPRKDRITFDNKAYPVLSQEQINAVDIITGQMLFEARDLAKASLSVSDQIDVSAAGSLLEPILSRYTALARLRAETSGAVSARLRGFGSGSLSKKQLIARASDAAANEVATFKEVLKSDPSNDLMEGFVHFTATANGKKQTFKDFNAFYKRKLKGYKEGDVYQRNAIINEMMTMGVNSMLSGPKTPVRALVGTGLGTTMRPVATILGAMGNADDAVLRGAFANLGGMIEARNEAFRKAIADFQSYNMKDDGWRGYIISKQDEEWEGMMSWAQEYGTAGEKAQAKFANALREINKMPVFNYGPRIMRSMDTFFTQIIGRGRQRQLAFNHVYDKLEAQGITVSDADLNDLVKAAEIDFENRVFSADGRISDEMAKFSADEAKLTQELSGIAKDLDRVFERAPYLRPFMLFARTGVNALNMTSKYTPILNSFITEHVDIMTKAFDDPVMMKYGIKTANDLQIAKATMRGRMAIGYGFTGTMAWMALNNQITGNGPPDRGLANSWRQMGWQPRSIKIGNSYISYESLEPFNGLMSLVADIVDAQEVMGDEWTSNNFGKISYIISANVTNKSFLAGLLQLQDLLTSQGGDAPRVAANFVNSQVPLSGLRNEIGKVLNPGMKELESGFLQSIQNRNLYADLINKDGKLPYRYDVLNGEPLRDYEPLTRIVNSIIPINLNVGTMNETRQLLMKSGLNLKQTFNTGPNGESLEGYPDLKSKYQFYMGQQNVEAQLTEALTDQLRESIQQMNKDRTEGRSYEPRHTLHGSIIHGIFRNAKSIAWQLLLEDPKHGGRAAALQELHQLGTLQDSYRKRGNYEADQQIDKKIEQIKNINNLPK